MTEASFHLLDSEREYLEEGTAPGAYRTHEMENRVTEKTELLPTRFERLFADLELLEQGSERTTDFLATETGRQAWLELLGIDEDPSRGELERSLSFHRGELGSAPAEFGAKLGWAVNRLMYWPVFSGLQKDDIVADLVWGFLRGLHYDPRRAGTVSEDVIRDDTTAILQQIEDRAHTHAENIQESPAGLLDRSQKRQAKKREMAVRVNEILGEDYPTTSLDMDWGFVNSGAVGERDEATSQFSYWVVAHLIDSAVDQGHPFNSIAQERAFWRDYGPVEEFEAVDFVTENQVFSLVESRQLHERYDLLEQLVTDVQALAKKGWKGTAAEDVLPYTVEQGPVSSIEIAEAIYSNRDYAASVTRLARDLAGVEVDDRGDEIDVWTDKPLLTGERDGWEATRYGEAANHALERHLGSEANYAQPVQYMPFPSELVDNAFTEVTMEGD